MITVKSKYGKTYTYDDDRSEYQKAYHRKYYKSKRKKPVMTPAQRKMATKLAHCRHLKKKANMVTYTDKSQMPFGTHQGKALANVPAYYFLYLRDQPKWDKTTPLGRYIEDNLDVLESQAKADVLKSKNLSR